MFQFYEKLILTFIIFKLKSLSTSCEVNILSATAFYALLRQLKKKRYPVDSTIQLSYNRPGPCRLGRFLGIEKVSYTKSYLSRLDFDKETFSLVFHFFNSRPKMEKGECQELFIRAQLTAEHNSFSSYIFVQGYTMLG